MNPDNRYPVSSMPSAEKVIASTALLLSGYSPNKIARLLNLRKFQMRDIEKFKEEMSRRLQNDQVWIDALKHELSKQLLTNARDALVHTNAELPKASALQAATIVGISLDKHLALTGKSPQQPVQLHLHAHVAKQIEDIDRKIFELTGGVDFASTDETKN